MRLLLDTHAFLWWCANDPRLSEPVIRTVSDADNDVYVSAASGWEIAIKARLGKLSLPDPPREFMTKMLHKHAFGGLNITLRHSLRDFTLPTHHSDLFDRLLVAQAQLETLTLVSDDPKIARYEVQLLW